MECFKRVVAVLGFIFIIVGCYAAYENDKVRSAQAQQTPLTKPQIEEWLKASQTERGYLEMKVRIVELQAQENKLKETLANMEKAKKEEPNLTGVTPERKKAK